MKQYFESVRNKMLETLSEKAFGLKSEDYSAKGICAVIENEKDSLKLEYIYSSKQFVLSRGEVGCAADDYVQSQAYLFDPEAGDEMRHTASVANEFLDTLQSRKPVNYAGGQKKKKDKDSDENTAVFFVNRVATVLPECREPLLRHKAHYETLLPRHFCEEVVTVALRDAFDKGEKAKQRSFFELINNLYATGDMDTKSIIMQVIMPEVKSEQELAFVEGIVSADFKKAWNASKKYHGKDVKPEKLSAVAKMAKYQAETLAGTQR